MVRKQNTVAAPSNVISDIEEVGRAIIDINDIETDVQDGPAPKRVALKHLTTAFIENNPQLFEFKNDARDGRQQVVYNGRNGE